MLQLTRTVRFSVNPGPATGEPANTFAAYPTMSGLGRHYELDARCVGDVDPRTGYFVNIKDIDHAARTLLIPAIERACRENPEMEPGELLANHLPALSEWMQRRGARVRSVRWKLSPFYSVEVDMQAPHTAVLRQQFEFAASHRLHCPELSDEQNREMFGKCTNPSGHGHNYRVEPAVEVPVGAPAGTTTFTLADLERVTAETIIKRFDHMHLNVDVPEFRTGTGLNPSVENIAKVCYDLLDAALRKEHPGVRLRSVTVWETEKTSCMYPA